MIRLLIFIIAALIGAPAALAGPGMFVGANEDTLKWADNPSSVSTVNSAFDELGLHSFRVAQEWKLGQSSLSADQAFLLDRLFANAGNRHVLLNVMNFGANTPLTDTERTNFCSYVNDILNRFPQVEAVNIGNEVNKSQFWRPQFENGQSAAPAAYVALLARCYSVVKPAHPNIPLLTSLSPRGNDNPDAVSNISHSPIKFIEEMGKAYRAQGLTGKIFDHWGQNTYAATSNERPWRSHPNNLDISQGDYTKMMTALKSAFGGTGQPVPGTAGVTVWYLESGFQTTVVGKESIYTGTETDPKVLAPSVGGDDSTATDEKSDGPDQARQLADAIRLAYCQPAVGAFYNFHIADESDLAAWQSGVLYADWTKKASFDAVKQAISEVNSGSVDCANLKGAAKKPSDASAPGVDNGGANLAAAKAKLMAAKKKALADLRRQSLAQLAACATKPVANAKACRAAVARVSTAKVNAIEKSYTAKVNAIEKAAKKQPKK